MAIQVYMKANHCRRVALKNFQILKQKLDGSRDRPAQKNGPNHLWPTWISQSPRESIVRRGEGFR